MRGGYFDLGSATFNMTRIVTGQLDAYVDVGRYVVDVHPALEAAFRRVGDGAVCTNFPYDVAAAALIVQEAGRGGDPPPTAVPSPAIRPSGRATASGSPSWRARRAALHDRLLEAIGRRDATIAGPGR